MLGKFLAALILLLLQVKTAAGITCPPCTEPNTFSRCHPDCLMPSNSEIGNDGGNLLGITRGIQGVDPDGEIFPSLPFDPYDPSIVDRCPHESCCECALSDDLPGFSPPAEQQPPVPNFTPRPTTPLPGFVPAGETTTNRPYTFRPQPSNFPPFSPDAPGPLPGFAPPAGR